MFQEVFVYSVITDFKMGMRVAPCFVKVELILCRSEKHVLLQLKQLENQYLKS